MLNYVVLTDMLKALVAIKNLLQLRTTEAQVLKHFCDLDGALEKMREQLQQLILEGDRRDYAMDVESLRREVELIYHGKLEKVTTWYLGCQLLNLNLAVAVIMTGNPGYFFV